MIQTPYGEYSRRYIWANQLIAINTDEEFVHSAAEGSMSVKGKNKDYQRPYSRTGLAQKLDVSVTTLSSFLRELTSRAV